MSVEATKNRFYILDLARFAAALSVMLYHYTATGVFNADNPRYDLIAPKDYFPLVAQVTKFGFLGLNLFFMLSGFVIFASAMNRTPLQFGVSRGLRLYPTYWACVAITTLIMWLFLGPQFDIGTGYFLSNLTMVQSLFGYPNIDPVYWTLFYELQFYAYIFVLMLCGVLRFYRVWLALWLAVVAADRAWGIGANLPWFLTQEYAPYFISGLLYYVMHRDGFGKWLLALQAGTVLVTFYDLAQRLPLDDRLHTYGDVAVTMVVVSLFHVLFTMVAAGRLAIGKSRLVFVLGGLTYPLYLLHFAIGRYVFHDIAPVLGPGLAVLIMVPVALLAAFCVFYVVDYKLVPVVKRGCFRLISRLPTIPLLHNPPLHHQSK